MLKGRKDHVCGDECSDLREVSVRLEWSPQILEHHIVWDNRGGAETEGAKSGGRMRGNMGGVRSGVNR